MVQGPSGPGDFGWNRAHFGAWAISSAPLVIGADLTDNAVMQKAMPILSNTEAIAINQNWAGHPGMLVQGHGNEGRSKIRKHLIFVPRICSRSLVGCSASSPVERGTKQPISGPAARKPSALAFR